MFRCVWFIPCRSAAVHAAYGDMNTERAAADATAKPIDVSYSATTPVLDSCVSPPLSMWHHQTAAQSAHFESLWKMPVQVVISFSFPL